MLAVALDLEDAYNLVQLPILADKTLQLGIPVTCCDGSSEHLEKRRCMLKYGSWRSDWLTVRTGLPQGSPLSCVLFNIYTLNIARQTLNSWSCEDVC